jgi:hypothetical protein
LGGRKQLLLLIFLGTNCFFRKSSSSLIAFDPTLLIYYKLKLGGIVASLLVSIQTFCLRDSIPRLKLSTRDW